MEGVEYVAWRNRVWLIHDVTCVCEGCTHLPRRCDEVQNRLVVQQSLGSAIVQVFPQSQSQ